MSSDSNLHHLMVGVLGGMFYSAIFFVILEAAFDIPAPHLLAQLVSVFCGSLAHQWSRN